MAALVSSNPFQQTEFILSAARIAQLPEDSGAEVAFAGRSNAGKSSAMNRLCQQKALARTSKTPGRTQLINLFAVAPDKRLADLPGYGFAKVPEAVRRRWGQLIGHYMEQRRCLNGVVIVMDCRHPMKDTDLQMLDWCAAVGIPAHCLLTKSDKLKRGAANQARFGVERQLKDYGDGFSTQLFSALNGSGVETLRQRLAGWLELPTNNH